MSVFLNNWSGITGLLEDFNLEPNALDGYEVLLASYGYESYDGYAFVLLKKDGRLFEVNASHNSSCGLEGQFMPEETTTESLAHRLENGTLGKDGENNFADDLKGVLVAEQPS